MCLHLYAHPMTTLHGQPPTSPRAQPGQHPSGQWPGTIRPPERGMDLLTQAGLPHPVPSIADHPVLCCSQPSREPRPDDGRALQPQWGRPESEVGRWAVN